MVMVKKKKEKRKKKEGEGGKKKIIDMENLDGKKKKGYLLCLFRISLDLVGYVCIYVTAICLRVFLPEGAKDDVFAKRFSRSSAVMQHPQIYDIYIYIRLQNL